MWVDHEGWLVQAASQTESYDYETDQDTITKVKAEVVRVKDLDPIRQPETFVTKDE